MYENCIYIKQKMDFSIRMIIPAMNLKPDRYGGYIIHSEYIVS